MRRLNQIDAIRHTTDKHQYITTIERLKNDKNGNPRYKAVLIVADDRNAKSLFNAVYTTKGYFTAMQLAEHIAKEFERGLKD